jgi:hypothetical protein
MMMMMMMILPSVEVMLGFYYNSVDQQDMMEIFKNSYVYCFSVAAGEEKVQLFGKASCAMFLSIKFVNKKGNAFS